MLFERVTRQNGRAVVNLDDEGARSVFSACDGLDVLTYALGDPNASLHTTAREFDRFGFRADVTLGDTAVRVESPLLGAFNVSNALCAAGIALCAEVPVSTIVETLASPPTISGRMAMVDEGQPFSMVVDYAHTPASLEKVLTLLRSLNPNGRLIVVSGSAGERDREKRPIQGAVCARLADTSIFTNEDPRYEDARSIVDQIADGAIAAGGIENETVYRIVDRADAIAFAVGLAREEDTILLAGKGHERSIIIGGEKMPWNEAEVARTAIRQSRAHA
jgi:UDP-N-acetylmuramoyl-L-alanyl-D-glutamate--2,6-diaminopimelate ligase